MQTKAWFYYLHHGHTGVTITRDNTRLPTLYHHSDTNYYNNNNNNLDFSNTYNTVRMDAILETVAAKMPELYHFVHSSLACGPKLIYGIYIIESAEGSQQGDPLWP